MVKPIDYDSPARPGASTTEYAQVRTGNVWAIIAVVLGVIVMVASSLVQTQGDTTIGILAGAALSIAGVVESTLVKLGYIKARREVKKAALMNGKA